MARLEKGSKMPEFIYDTPFEAGYSIADTVKKVKGRTALVFLRYYGCTLCQYDISQYATQYDAIAATGGQLLVVLQSAPGKLAKEMKDGDLPFRIICDPKQTLYQEFEIIPAKSKPQMVDAHTMKKIAQAKMAGFQHGEYEGEELQLPAAFVLEPDLTITYAHYGRTVGDVPDSLELAELLKKSPV